MVVQQFDFGVNSVLETKFWKLAKTIYSQDDKWSPQSETLHANSIALMQNQTGVQIQGFLVEIETKVITRAVTVVFNQVNRAWLGLFEALEQEAVAVQLLFKTCEATLKPQQIKEYSAPRLDHQIIGLQTGGFDFPQSILTPHNPAYYEQYFKQNGFSVSSKSISLIVRKKKLILTRLQLPWIKIRHFNLEKIAEEIEIFNKLQGAVFSGRAEYSPRTLAQDEVLIKSLVPMLDPELVIIAEDLKGSALGIIIALPDHYQSKKPLTRARIISMGTLPEFQAKGVGAMLVLHLAKTMVSKGYETAEVSWVLKDNQPPQTLSNRFGAEPGREFCLYQKQL